MSRYKTGTLKYSRRKISIIIRRRCWTIIWRSI